MRALDWAMFGEGSMLTAVLTRLASRLRAEFRENRHVNDPEKVRALVSEARTGLITLRSQSGLSSKSTDLDFKFGEHG